MLASPIFGLLGLILVAVTCGIEPLEAKTLMLLILLLRLVMVALRWLATPTLLVSTAIFGLLK